MTPAEIRACASAFLPSGATIDRLSVNMPDNARFDVVIGVPARDEAAVVQRCIASLAQSCNHASVRCLLVLVVNNTIDATHDLALVEAERLGLHSVIASICLPTEHAHVGHARGVTLDLAAELSDAQAALMTTDADTLVGLDWVKANLAEIENGAALVCGAISLDAEDDAGLSELMRANGAAEGRYLSKMWHLEALIDPAPRSVWPHHGGIGGASIAVSRDAYLAVGGLPRVACSEDRALLEEFRRHDLPIAFSSEASVLTSGRFAGRAPGGLAETLALRDHDPDAPLDVRAEPALAWHARLQARAVARFLHRQQIGMGAFARNLGLSPAQIELVCEEERFGSTWANLESSTFLRHRIRLRPRDIQTEEPILDSLLAAAEARNVELLTPASLAQRRNKDAGDNGCPVDVHAVFTQRDRTEGCSLP